MSSERAGTPFNEWAEKILMAAQKQSSSHTSGALNREKAREVLDRERQPYDGDVDDLITELESCVVPDPRLARIEALLDEADQTVAHKGDGELQTREVRAILRGDQ